MSTEVKTNPTPQNPLPSIPFNFPNGFDGSLQIIGVDEGRTVRIVARNEKLACLFEFPPAFTKNCVPSFQHDKPNVGIMEFDYKLASQLNNPAKLLRQVRNRLFHAIGTEYSRKPNPGPTRLAPSIATQVTQPPPTM